MEGELDAIQPALSNIPAVERFAIRSHPCVLLDKMQYQRIEQDVGFPHGIQEYDLQVNSELEFRKCPTSSYGQPFPIGQHPPYPLQRTKFEPGKPQPTEQHLKQKDRQHDYLRLKQPNRAAPSQTDAIK